MFEAIIDKFKGLAELDGDKIINEVIEDEQLQAQIIDLQTEANGQGQLYDKGVDSDGNSLGEYAPITINYYKPLAASEGRDGRTDHITLKDTGTFYKSMKVVNKADSFEIDADDPNNLQGRYPDLLGLTDDSKNEIIPQIRDSLIEKLKDLL